MYTTTTEMQLRKEKLELLNKLKQVTIQLNKEKSVSNSVNIQLEELKK